jgi:hypothetical protein
VRFNSTGVLLQGFSRAKGPNIYQEKCMSHKTNLIVDIGIFAAFMVIMEPGLTGLALHEWLSLAFAGTLIFHTLLHWRWIARVTSQLFNHLLHLSRLQWVVDLLLFAAFVTVMTSGLMISRRVLPFFDIGASRNFLWAPLHSESANATLLLTGLHFALDWNWTVAMLKRYLIVPLVSILPGHRLPAHLPVQVEKR